MAPAEQRTEYKMMSGRERAICSTVCLCLGLSVMSAVALIYLTVIIYVPTQKELASGIGETSVMCTTIEKRPIHGNVEECRWSSCAEWWFRSSRRNSRMSKRRESSNKSCLSVPFLLCKE